MTLNSISPEKNSITTSGTGSPTRSLKRKRKNYDGTDAEKASYALLEYLLLESLKILHPFMPFITEEIYQIFRPGKMLMVENW